MIWILLAIIFILFIDYYLTRREQHEITTIQNAALEMVWFTTEICIKKITLKDTIWVSNFYSYNKNSFFSNADDYISILLYPPTHYVSKRKHLATPTHPPFWLRNKWMVPNYKKCNFWHLKTISRSSPSASQNR